MSKGTHFSMEWLVDYNKRLDALLSRKSVDVEKMLTPYECKSSVAAPLRVASGKQTKTEQKYNREMLGGVGRFEAVTLHLPGGGRYTPDFMTIDDGVVTFHEVKGSYRLGSQGRAYTAFHEAAAYYPMWRFVWAHWTGKAWERKTVAEVRDLTAS